MNNSLRKSFCLALLAMALIAIAAPAWAIQVIRQTPSTTFPIMIAKSGSYMLGTDIVPTSTTVDAIDITASNVTLNLNGYSIIGPGSGSGTGINACPAFPTCQTNVTVTGGTVTAMGGNGIELGSDSQVEGVKALSNRNIGIVVEDNSEVANSVANLNSSSGIQCFGADCLIDDNTANANNTQGICTGIGATVVRNSASGNGGVGLDLGTDAGYGKNVMQGNIVGCVFFGTSMGDNICNGVKM